jgi:hypothetical protein
MPSTFDLSGEVDEGADSVVMASIEASLTLSSGEGGGASDCVVRHIQALLSDAGMCHLSDSVLSGSMPLWISREYLAGGRGDIKGLGGEER